MRLPIIKIDYISGQSERLKLQERMALSRREASLRTARARGFRDSFGTDSILSKLPLLHVSMGRLPVSGEASHDLWRSIGPSTMVNLQTSL